MRLRIEVVDPEGRPLLPANNATKFVHQCGVVVRDNVPISIPLWYKPANPEGFLYVSEELKTHIWNKLMAHFTLPVLDDREKAEKMRNKVKHWALKKMAEQFNKWKNKLYREYLDDKQPPEFSGTLESQRNHWDAFLEYKDSEKAKEKSAQNKENAKKKKYHHKLGGGGYKSAEPKWDQIEAEMRETGVIPETDEWARRIRNWSLAHGLTYDKETGALIVDDENQPIAEAKKSIVKAIEDRQKGKLISDREIDELTVALGNKEKGGRARGFGNTPWKLAFPEDAGTYRSRERARKRKEQEEEARLRKVEMEQQQLFALVKDYKQELDEFRAQAGATTTLPLQQDSQGGGAPSQRPRSSVASTGVLARYPVDDIDKKTACELHVGVMNLSLKAADGYVLTCESTARWHCSPIQDGFGRVGVDEIQPGYDSLELEIPGPEGERTLGEVGAGIILWRKQYIVFPDSGPRPSPPRRGPSPPSPHDDDRDNQYNDTSPSRSPPHEPTREPTPEPTRQPTPPPTKTQDRKSVV